MADNVQIRLYDEKEEALKRGMKTRHLTMIAIGGSISSGLFVASGAVLSSAGPLGAILCYIAGGVIMYAAMLSLGEMAVEMPISGSFQAYASKFISPFMGYITGWLYWLNWGTSGAAALIASAILMHGWFPGVQEWVWCLVFAGALTVVNLMPVGTFGEMEFWFAGIKVAAIILFIIIGGAIICGVSPSQGFHPEGFPVFYKDGWFPNGLTAVFLTMITVSVAYQGTELVGIAAGESGNPRKNVPRAIKQVGLRIFLFFVLSTAVMAMIIPFRKAGLSQSPFTEIFTLARIPYAAHIMNFVIITACLSSINSALYACSRLLWSLSHENMAPKFLGATSSGKVPVYGVLATLGLMLIALLTKFFGTERVYLMIINASGGIGCLIWAIIGLAQIGFRRYYRKHGGNVSNLQFRTALYPLIPVFGIVSNLVIVFCMCLIPDQRAVFYSGIGALAIISISYFWFMRKKRPDAHISE